MELEELARKYALKNAVEYSGECDPGAVIGKIMAEEDFNPEEVQKVAGRVCGKVNSMTEEEQRDELGEYEFEEAKEEHDPLPDLPGAEEGGVVVRFAPNPNSPPHIGHSRGMVINGALAEKYDGDLVLRFDDTDPRKKRPLKNDEIDAYEMYREDYTWLGYEPDRVIHSSKRFDEYVRHAEELIEMGKAYVCECSMERGREYRSKGEACPCRPKEPEENMELWKQMKEGVLGEGEAVLKIKTDLDHKNPAVRDFVAFRIIEDPDHPITGDEYSVWPMLDFAGAIEDHLTGTTHIVRGKDLRASTKRQEYIYEYFDWDYPEVRYWGNVKLTGTEAPVSSSSLKEMIQDGELEGWDDVRAPTLRGFRKRGFRPEALRNFWREMGVSEKDSTASIETLESYNRDIVEKSDRYFFVREPVELEIQDLPEHVKPQIPYHPEDPERGHRKPDLERDDGKVKVLVDQDDLEDGFLRLKGLCNLEVEGNQASFVEGDHTRAVERNAPIIHWVPGNADRATVVMNDGEEVEGRIEPHTIDEDEVVQFERFGFVRCEKPINNLFYYTHE